MSKPLLFSSATSGPRPDGVGLAPVGCQPGVDPAGRQGAEGREERREVLLLCHIRPLALLRPQFVLRHVGIAVAVDGEQREGQQGHACESDPPVPPSEHPLCRRAQACTDQHQPAEVHACDQAMELQVVPHGQEVHEGAPRGPAEIEQQPGAE